MAQPEAGAAPVQAAINSANSDPAIRVGGEDTGLAMNYCPRCSARLASRSCKLICPECGYYMSCSDFY
jgi:exosome complex RNA-binding protein Csl4